MEMPLTTDQLFMTRALELAQCAADQGEVPVGAVIVHKGKIVGEGYNQPITRCDPTAHAEIVALRAAAISTNNYRLPGCDLYVTIEPCTMCVGALMHARINRIIFGAAEPRAGALVSQLQLAENGPYNHAIRWHGGVLADQCSLLIKHFFKYKRALQKQSNATV
jgi:tRNA(adenine34) deaminase